MAKKYLLQKNDTRVDIDVFRTTWSDFDIPKDVWGIVRTVLRASAWMHQTKDKGNKTNKGVLNLFGKKKDGDESQVPEDNIDYSKISKNEIKKQAQQKAQQGKVFRVKPKEVKRVSAWLEKLEADAKGSLDLFWYDLYVILLCM
jgi:hypothetical protein